MEIKRVIEILSDKGMPDLVGGYDFDYDYDEYEEACNTAIQELEKIEKGVVPVDWHNSVYETIQKRYLDLLERTRWIQVSERLPTVKDADKETGLVLYKHSKGWMFTDYWFVTEVGKTAITHWMPLPEPPQEVE